MTKISASTKKGVSRAPPSNDDYDDVFERDSDAYDDVMVQEPKKTTQHRGHHGLGQAALIKELSRIPPKNPPQGHIHRNMSSKHHRSRSKNRHSDDSERVEKSSSTRSHRGHSSSSSKRSKR